MARKMLKLFTNENISAFSSDALYKICLALEQYGLTDDDIQSFETDEALFNAASYALEDGDDVIIAAENENYNAVKRSVISKLMLDEYSSPAIAERISQYADAAEEGIDVNAHCSIARNSVYHLSQDGLFSGFTAEVFNGSLTLIPLDFSRVDAILDSLVSLLFESDEEEPAAEENDAPDMGFREPVTKMVYALMQLDKNLAVATGEATKWIYNLYNEVEGLSEVVNFVEIPEQDDSDDSESARIIKKARAAAAVSDSDYGAAISEIYSEETENGTVYFAFVAVSDKKSAKAKKINTSNPDDLELLLPHCVAVLCDTICKKTETLNSQPADESKKAPAPKGKQKFSKGMIAFAAAILAAAILVPILIVNVFLKDDEPTSSVLPAIQTNPTQISSSDTSTLVPASDISTTLPGANNYLAPAEPSATDVSATPTAAPAPSTSGTFTFYVFGYGHGVGLSQNGANYLASLGWNYAQILANYYYGTTLVTGDTYPATINYAGSDYATREYLASALETEMGGSFQKEALKAQAVAIYTFAKYNGYKLNADANAFGKTPSQVCLEVVDEVMNYGLYIAYNGKTALTPFQSISAGVTTSYNNVWGSTALPYLGGGRPSYGDFNVADYKSTYSISSEDFKALASAKLGVTLSGDPATWITIVSHDQAVNADIGYVSKINIGGKEISGNEFRGKVLEGRIRSHCFMLVYTPAA